MYFSAIRPILSDRSHLYFPCYTGSRATPRKVPSVTVNINTISINGNNVSLMLSWGEPFNNFDPIVSYTVSCSGDDPCPPNFTTTSRNYTITNLTPKTNYTFSVVATNSIGSGEAGKLVYATPGQSTVLHSSMLTVHRMYLLSFNVSYMIIYVYTWVAIVF